MGYMPDFSGGSGSTFSITFCTVGGGTSTMLVNLDVPSNQSLDDHFNGKSCAFGIAASQAMMPGHAALLLISVVFPYFVLLSHRNQTRPPLPALGPPLGSRAPPSNLG